MPRTYVMVNGLPGNVARTLVPHVTESPDLELVPASLTGSGITDEISIIAGRNVELITPEIREERIENLKDRYRNFIAIDYTHPSAVNSNAEFYATHGIPYVMGTTGGDRDALVMSVKRSAISAVIAPNMDKQIVGFQAMMAFAAETFPGLFSGFDLEIEESHQKGKADTSGTAKAMVGHFNHLGLDFAVEDIRMERDPKKQKSEWGIPEAHLDGHAWHTYTLKARDGSSLFRFQHNINGRDNYGHGTLAAVRYLKGKLAGGSAGEVFSMIDVLKSA